MKVLRLFLLVLMAMLLPLRGAVAASLQCEAPAGWTITAADDAAQDAPPHHHVHEPDHGTPHAAAATPACNLCVASCAMTPLPMQMALRVTPAALSALWRFPPLAVPAAQFVADSLERPPRG